MTISQRLRLPSADVRQRACLRVTKLVDAFPAVTFVAKNCYAGTFVA